VTTDKNAWRVIRTLREDVREMRGQLDIAMTRIRELETQTPQARQLAYEADLAAADLAASGYDDTYEGQAPVGTDRHGASCLCPYCYDEPDDYDMPGYDYDPGPERDDQGGMSEYRITVAGTEESS